jgi:hypothetical protein
MDTTNSSINAALSSTLFECPRLQYMFLCDHSCKQNCQNCHTHNIFADALRCLERLRVIDHTSRNTWLTCSLTFALKVRVDEVELGNLTELAHYLTSRLNHFILITFFHLCLKYYIQLGQCFMSLP